MESDPALNSALAALGEISEEDLSNMLQIDMMENIIEPSQENDKTLTQNRQELTSQFSISTSKSDHNLSEIIADLEMDLLQESEQNNSISNSVIFTTQHIERIEVNESSEAIKSQKCQQEKDDIYKLPKKHNEILLPFGTETSNSTNTIFGKELECLSDDDFELESQLNKLTTSVTKSSQEQTQENNSAKYEQKFLTQVESREINRNRMENMFSSCPNFNNNFKNPRNLSLISTPTITTDCDNFLDVHLSNVSSIQISENSSIEMDNDISSISATAEIHNENFISKQIRQFHNFTADTTTIPASVQQLYDLMKANYSDFSFVYALSAQLCQDQVPMACFVNVKMALILSIASIGKNPDIPPVPIIVMGNDSYMANLLITNIADLAARFVGPVDDVKIPSSDDRNNIWIEADPVQLAKDGVFYTGNWSCLKSARSENIFKCIENSGITVENSTRIYPLQTAIWAHWRAFKYNAKDQQIFNKFVKIFGIPVYMDDSNHEVLVDHILKQASIQLFESTVDHLSISSDDMRSFLAIISARTVDMTSEAMSLLRKYFIASRVERPDCLTKQAFVVLKLLAESFAKLSLRHEVLPIDAVGAIFLCEHFIQHIYGAGMDPPPVLESGNFVGHVDAFIASFHEWINSYIAKYCDK